VERRADIPLGPPLLDGASQLQIFLRIICPIAVPGTVSTLLFAFLLAWQDLLWALSSPSTRSGP
jgi:ABC-type glycerol-3-phosphate transport system permease component